MWGAAFYIERVDLFIINMMKKLMLIEKIEPVFFITEIFLL